MGKRRRTPGSVVAIDGLRAAELAFLDTGEERHLDEAEAIIDSQLSDAPFASATRLWLSLQRYDLGGDGHCLDTAAAARAANGDSSLAAAAVAALLRRWARDGQAADLDRAIGLARSADESALDAVGGHGRPLWLSPAWRAIDLGNAYLERSRAGAASGADDLLAARGVLRHAVRVAPAPAVLALGLRHLAGCEHELYGCGGGRRLLDQAIRRFQRALAMVTPRSVLRPMLLTELGTALQDRFAADEDLADIDAAVADAEQAVTEATAAGASRPDLACHLVNLGTALDTRYERTGDPRDQNAAVRRWAEAVEQLPTTSAFRPAFLDRLALGLTMRWQYGNGGEEDLDAAIDYGRAAVSEGAADASVAVYASNLADALDQRWELHRDPGDLDEAVRVFVAAMDGPARGGPNATELAVNLAHTLLARYQAVGGAEDLDATLAALDRIPAKDLRGARRSSAAAVTARVLAMRYEADGDPADLAAAIAAAWAGLAGVGAASTTRNSRTARLAHLLYLRFARYGRRRDLDRAIRLLSDVAEGAAADDAEADTGDDEPHAASPDQLSQLAGYLSERYDDAGSPADRNAAIEFSRRALAADRRDGEPAVDAAIGSSLHDRFGAMGWLDDLDEVIARYREALTRQVPTAPVYPAIQSNAALALQDCFRYRDDSPALDEAIELHELAVSACPPRAPDRPGYLGTLAAAVLLRFERDGRQADLHRAISLDEEALGCLSPGATERAALLGGLAQARHLLATATGRLADFDDAVSAYRSALRRLRVGSRVRPAVLDGYARALAEHPGGASRAAVLRAFRTAIAASAGAPLVSFDVADSLADWASRNGLWSQAAEAYRLAADARRTLFAAQLDRAYQETWLARGVVLSAAEAQAWTRSGEPRQAVVALEAGRALALSEALELRAAPGRLLNGNQRELADRYERAVGLLRRAAAVRSGHEPASSLPGSAAMSRSFLLRSTQNSLPSGSASVTQPAPSGLR